MIVEMRSLKEEEEEMESKTCGVTTAVTARWKRPLHHTMNVLFLVSAFLNGSTDAFIPSIIPSVPRLQPTSNQQQQQNQNSLRSHYRYGGIFAVAPTLFNNHQYTSSATKRHEDRYRNHDEIATAVAPPTKTKSKKKSFMPLDARARAQLESTFVDFPNGISVLEVPPETMVTQQSYATSTQRIPTIPRVERISASSPRSSTTTKTKQRNTQKTKTITTKTSPSLGRKSDGKRAKATATKTRRKRSKRRTALTVEIPKRSSNVNGLPRDYDPRALPPVKRQLSDRYTFMTFPENPYISDNYNATTLEETNVRNPIASSASLSSLYRHTRKPRQVDHSAILNDDYNMEEQQSRNRSSTMYGLSNRGHVYDKRDTTMSKEKWEAHVKRRRTESSIAMYRNEPSVPDSLVDFLGEIQREELLRPEEEFALGERIQRAMRLLAIYDVLECKLRRQPSSDEWCRAISRQFNNETKMTLQEIREIVHDGLEAKSKLVSANLRLVQGVINVYLRRGLSGKYNSGDLMHEGIMGLVRAAEKFQPKRGFRFSTYALFWIRSSVKNCQNNQKSGFFRFPQRIHPDLKVVRKARDEFIAQTGQSPSVDDLARITKLTASRIENCLRADSLREYSLDAALQSRDHRSSGSDPGRTLHDLLGGIEKTDTEYDDDFARKRLVEEIYKFLDPTTARMVLLKYGLFDPQQVPQGYEGSLNYAQLSRLLGISQHTVKKVITKGLERLRICLGPEWRM